MLRNENSKVSIFFCTGARSCFLLQTRPSVFLNLQSLVVSTSRAWLDDPDYPAQRWNGKEGPLSANLLRTLLAYFVWCHLGDYGCWVSPVTLPSLFIRHRILRLDIKFYGHNPENDSQRVPFLRKLEHC